ncbi:MAG TPA: molybdopterin-dependent oxidoreductase [Bryobacteraceae bacterium]|nr:molybdopterin-dependent oxidoreductase [Bryobacteraceae bacterium]
MEAWPSAGRTFSTRRAFLAAGLALPFAALAADEQLVPFADYDPEYRADAQDDHPRVKSFDLRKLDSPITPASDFFTFHQTSTLDLDAQAWRLRIGGLVKRPVELALSDLLKRDRREMLVTIECSGNTGDPQIMNGLVSTAVWSGVGLAALLNECGVLPEAREAVLLGADVEQDPKFEAGGASYVSPHGWSLFIQDAMAAGNLLAFAMNGRPLEPEHGFPLRLVMPGWYGMSQIKWLTRIELIDWHYEGRHMARNYQSLRALDGDLWLDSSISRNRLKSVVARVTRRRAGQKFEYKIAGAAWGGPATINRIEVRIDGGEWRAATIEERAGDEAWVLWSMRWPEAAAGEHVIVSRAINARGEIQPTREEIAKLRVSNREDNSQWPRRVRIE